MATPDPVAAGNDESPAKNILELISDLNAKLVSINDVDELLKTAARLITKDLDYYYVSIFTLNDETDQLELRASSSVKRASKIIPQLKDHRIFMGDHIIGRAAETGRLIYAKNVEEEPLYFKADALPETRAELAIPLKVGNKVLGVLDFQSDLLDGFSGEDLLFLSAIADNLALAMHRLTLYKNLELRTDQLDLIARVGKELTSVLDLDTLLQNITQMMHDEFDYPEVNVFLVEHAPLRIKYKAGSGRNAQRYQDIGYTLELEAKLGLVPEAIRTGKIQFVNDVSEDPRYLRNPFDETQHGSELIVPLEFGGVVFGVLDVEDGRKNAFSEHDVELLTTLSAHISIAVRNASLYNSQNWRREVAERMRDTALVLAKSLPLDETIERILSGILKVLPSDLAVVALFEPEDPIRGVWERKLKVSQTLSEGDLDLQEGFELDPENAWYMEGFSTVHPVIRHAGQSDQIIKALGLREEASAISAPLTVGEEPVGVLMLYNAKPFRYGTESTRLMSTWSGYLGSALENEKLEEESQSQSWISTILLQVALSTHSLTNIAELTEVMGQLLMLLIGGRAGGILSYDAANSSFILEASFGMSGEDKAYPYEVKDKGALLGAVQAQTLTAIPASKMDAEFRKKLGLSPRSTLLLMPLVVHDQTLGLLMHIGNVDYIDISPERVLGKQQLAILNGLAQQTALSMQNIRFVSEAEEDTLLSTILLQISKILVGGDSVRAGLHQLVHLVYDLAGFETLALLSYKPDEYLFQTEYRVEDRNLPFKFVDQARLPEKDLPGHQIFGSLMAKTLPFQKLSALLEPNEGRVEAFQAWAEEMKAASWVIMPVSSQTEHYGLILALDSRRYGRNRRMELLKDISLQIGSALQNAEYHQVRHEQDLVEKELNLARQIQKNFLPETLPEVPGYDLGVVWQTARQVGGDFYDVFKVDENHWGFVIADVSDKGMPAALYMTVARTLIRAMGMETISPAETLMKVNRLLQSDSKEGFFITCFYGVLDCQNQLLHYATAGHNPPVILKHSDNSANFLQKGSLALGILDQVNYQDHSLALEAGDALVLYTDGVTETVSEKGKFFGNENLLNTLSQAEAGSAEDLVNTILAALDKHKGQMAAGDDVTILAIKRC